jgi:hypothetical protein
VPASEIFAVEDVGSGLRVSGESERREKEGGESCERFHVFHTNPAVRYDEGLTQKNWFSFSSAFDRGFTAAFTPRGAMHSLRFNFTHAAFNAKNIAAHKEITKTRAWFTMAS